MAGEPPPPQGVSSLPLPPIQYINLYTDDNVKNNRVPKPPPPIKDQYTMFGTQFHADDQIIRPLESQGFRRLYPQHYDHKRELKKLNQSILINFLDILDILINSPDSQKRPEKVDDLTLLFIHMHHLINEFRPHQARETLRVMMEVQKKQRLETSERFQKQFTCVQEMLHSCLRSLPDGSAMDTKLVIKKEVEPEVSIKQEKEELTEEEESQSVSTLDQMMCDIVDAM